MLIIMALNVMPAMITYIIIDLILLHKMSAGLKHTLRLIFWAIRSVMIIIDQYPWLDFQMNTLYCSPTLYLSFNILAKLSLSLWFMVEKHPSIFLILGMFWIHNCKCEKNWKIVYFHIKKIIRHFYFEMFSSQTLQRDMQQQGKQRWICLHMPEMHIWHHR